MAALKDYKSPHGISIHKFTDNPAKAYETMKWDHLKTVEIKIPSTPVSADKVRIVCISDTHCKTRDLVIPDGDILLHGGDFTSRGRIEEVANFAAFMKKQPHKHKVVIAGNHELCFGYCDGYCDPITLERLCGQSAKALIESKLVELNVSHPKELLEDCIYLDNSSVTVCGLKIWGSPWTPHFHGWAYNAVRGAELLNIWDRIPNDSDIVMTHGPPLGIGDLTVYKERAGCVELLTTITTRVKPKLHLFGHIHEAYGMFTDDTTQFINASTCTVSYQARHSPICVDVDLPEGFTKDDVTIHPVEDTTPILSQVYARVDNTEEKAVKGKMGGILSALKNRFRVE